MERIGYDADTKRYFFRDPDGSVWQGEEGEEFGRVTRGVEQPFSSSCSMSLELVDS